MIIQGTQLPLSLSHIHTHSETLCVSLSRSVSHLITLIINVNVMPSQNVITVLPDRCIKQKQPLQHNKFLQRTIAHVQLNWSQLLINITCQPINGGEGKKCVCVCVCVCVMCVCVCCACVRVRPVILHNFCDVRVRMCVCVLCVCETGHLA